MKRREIATSVILSIVTCGIYGIYWFVCMVDELNAAIGDQQGTSGVTVFLLGLVTCGIYLFYWWYKAAEKVNAMRQMNGYPVDGNNSVLYLLLCIFGLSIVNYCLLQSELNRFYGEG